MKIYSVISSVLIIAAVFIGCEEEGRHPYGSDATPPGPVVVKEVTNMHGKSVVHYQSPNDVDLLYVKAEFIDDRGVLREVKASAAIDSLLIEGFADAKEYEVTLYAVDRGENHSTPTLAKVNPLTPPLDLIFPTLKGEVDYGGIKVSYENSEQAEVSINLIKYEENQDKYIYKESLFTSQPSGSYSFRGYSAVFTQFGVYVEDRWGNLSDTTYFEMTPIPDTFLDKEKFSVFKISGDKDFNDYGFSEDQMWDGQWGNQWNCGHTAFEDLPHRLTIDLGVKVKLSRFKLYQRGGDELYKHGNPKRFNIYGTLDVNELPPYDPANPNAGWTFLKECHSFKPSGTPVGQATSEDHAYQNKGEDFEFDVNNLVEVRYVRLENLETWGEQRVTVIGELSFWGEITEEVN
ncbi:DUF5000 domain-containing lipoprotein [Carboxylicivirga marina]|uniref:DUF4959 domain-containing protein n=1 Tax=Carboxylicivirga marina TaxID=2800988 RepID=A0ABS1HNB9_9BACT|nr:DUF5000 domain-containing lipoprotein [Carboxylicivirga marina]MBK3519164.1 DUF4959 domain-containing protein [Carboxylicivirga marina]